MPIYDYVCQDCGEKFEKLTLIGKRDSNVVCPVCGGANAERSAVSLFAVSGTSATGSASEAANCAPAGGG